MNKQVICGISCDHVLRSPLYTLLQASSYQSNLLLKIMPRYIPALPTLLKKVSVYYIRSLIHYLNPKT